MGKNKKHRNEGRARAGQRAPGARGGNSWPLALFGLLILAVGAYAFWSRPSGSSGDASFRRIVPGGERRPTLDPALFTGVVQRGYQIAREIPQVLDQLYCWCKCVEDHGHKSNLSCFADSHAAGWNVCVEQALVASEMTAKGKTPAEIQRELDRRFG